jgi:hypothetical protein
LSSIDIIEIIEIRIEWRAPLAFTLIHGIVDLSSSLCLGRRPPDTSCTLYIGIAKTAAAPTALVEELRKYLSVRDPALF